MLSARDGDFIKDSLAEVRKAGQPFVYKVFQSTNQGDKTRGISPTNNYTNISMTGPVEELSLEYIQSSGGVFKAGDISCVVDLQTVGQKDRVVVDCDWYQPVEKKRIWLGAHYGWVLRCKKVPAED